MDPATIALAISFIEAAARLAPQLEAAFSSGQVSPEQQAALIAAQKAIAKSFSGPEWEVTKTV